MNESLKKRLLELFDAAEIREVEFVQHLWSDYGQLSRVSFSGAKVSQVIVKNIQLPHKQNHPRGWNTDTSHLRKVKSYQVEVAWYKKWASRCNEKCRLPECYEAISEGEEYSIVLEDLDLSGFPLRKSGLNLTEAKQVLSWLANFHATFLNEIPTNLWEEGTYWHLATRPDELAAMKSGKLKNYAGKLNSQLANCQFKTIVHGDAKVANFCFSEEMNRVAAVDFQYVGGGCGMKDVVYFLGSCFTEKECEKYEEEALMHYFSELEKVLVSQQQTVDFNALKKEWSRMYAIAWADFTRFLLGWMPGHHKINSYSTKLVDQAIALIE